MMRQLLLAGLVGWFVLGTGQALAASVPLITVIGGGMTTPATNGGCLAGSGQCLGENEQFDLAAGASASGTLQFAGLGETTVDVNLTVAEVTFTSVGAGAVEEIVFSNLVYAATVAVTATGDPAVFFTSFLSGATSASSLTGTYASFGPGGSVVDPAGTVLNVTPDVTVLTCTIFTGLGQCNVGFAAFPISIGGVGYEFVHSFDLTVDPPVGATPEPAAALLITLALASLGFARRAA